MKKSNAIHASALLALFTLPALANMPPSGGLRPDPRTYRSAGTDPLALRAAAVQSKPAIVSALAPIPRADAGPEPDDSAQQAELARLRSQLSSLEQAREAGAADLEQRDRRLAELEDELAALRLERDTAVHELAQERAAAAAREAALADQLADPQAHPREPDGRERRRAAPASAPTYDNSDTDQNDAWPSASTLGCEAQVEGNLSGVDREDWFLIRPEQNGYLSIGCTNVAGGRMKSFELRQKGGSVLVREMAAGSSGVIHPGLTATYQLPVQRQESYWLRLQHFEQEEVRYSLTTSLQPLRETPDAEPNDLEEQAIDVAGSGSFAGSVGFRTADGEAWRVDEADVYHFTAPSDGKLYVTIQNRSEPMEWVLLDSVMVEKRGAAAARVGPVGIHGAQEFTIQKPVAAKQGEEFLVRVRPHQADGTFAAEYRLTLYFE